jgi:ABC-type lipoprotein release transport system permease subunit
MFFFLAVRNITGNFKDRAVTVLLITIITFIFFAGNSIIVNANKNIKKIFVESITGDVVLEKSAEITMNLFGANIPVIDAFFNIPILPAYNLAMELISGETGIEGITSQVSGKAVLDISGIREPVLLAGVDAVSYFPLFSGIILEEGGFLSSGEYGAMITLEKAQKIEEKSGQRPFIGMPIKLTTGSSAGFKIREVPLTGVFRYVNPGQFMNDIIIVDPQTVRVLNSIHIATNTQTHEPSVQLLNVELEDIFNDAYLFDGNQVENEFSVEILENYITNAKTETGSHETGGDWNFIILRLKKGISSSDFINKINKKLEPYGIKAVNWRIAAGTSAILIVLIMALFNSGIFLVGLSGIIAVINILLISVFRRVREIGTLRAIGASDSFLRFLIFTENILVAVTAGFSGVLLGFLFIKWVNFLDLKISNELLVSIFNGQILRIEYIPGIAVLSFIIAVFLGLIVAIYPVETAVRIEPVSAVQKG